jgi:hypothetical protein
VAWFRFQPRGIAHTLPGAGNLLGGLLDQWVDCHLRGGLVVGMGAALEVGKLSAVAWLGQRRGAAPLRFALVALVAVLMVLNSIGVYGFLSRAHIEHALARDLTVASRAADVDARLTVQAGVVADLDHRIGQVDAAVEKTTERGRGKAAMTLADEQRKNRAGLVATRQQEVKALADFQVQKAAVEGERKVVEADTGPVRYLATLLGSTDEATMRWFILSARPGGGAVAARSGGAGERFMKPKRKSTVTLRLPPKFVSMYEGHGVEPDQVLRGFIADLCELRTADYNNTGGSDERLYAGRYYDRRGYPYRRG